MMIIFVHPLNPYFWHSHSFGTRLVSTKNELFSTQQPKFKQPQRKIASNYQATRNSFFEKRLTVF